ncbi:uncharacterized protein LOC143190024 [Rhynchophorus ferrugineus]|uniref:uncharacterized protein LOC143190024 n=1 Tax=Rhynchophorus ferrugineus TaxID=354439 RepID=UPI003FCC9BCF
MEKKTRKYYERGVNKEHLAELAKPKRRISLEEEADINRSRKKPSSKYKASKRIQNLAQPKHVVQKKIDRQPSDDETRTGTSVRSSALTYRPTQRIVELARPK